LSRSGTDDSPDAVSLTRMALPH